MQRITHILLLCMVAALLCACGQEPLPRGVVAEVNGQFIHLRTLETMLDTRMAELGAFENPSLEKLRAQYGAALTSLIVQALVMEELRERGLAVSDADVSAEEEAIRKDYEDTFDRHVTESAIDQEAWREIMRGRLGMTRFMTRVLLPTLVVPLEEIELYYHTHEGSFTVPRMLNLVRMVCATREQAEQARLTEDFRPAGEECLATPVSVRYDSVPVEWEKALRALKPGETTPVRAQDGRFEAVRLLRDTPVMKLDITAAYPYIERILMEDKLDEAFQAWLQNRLQHSRVRISVHLLDEVRGAPS